MFEPVRLDRTLIRVSGDGAIAFLNNLLTQNVERLRSEPVIYSALLNPQGKVIADMFVWAHEGDLVIEADAARGGDLFRRLSMYRLRAAIVLEDISTRAAIVASTEGAVSDPRLAALGARTLAAASSAARDGSAYHAHRIKLGAPDLASDAAVEEVFAGEALLEELNGVDFQKGCFVGQENVSRMKRRATTRKKFCPISFHGPPPAHGAAILAGAAELGAVRSGIPGRAIALLRLDRAAEAAEKGEPLTADGRIVQLDPPSWLILPQRDPA
ncbi:MAG: folate-binding protein YgfZ [Hyphomonadaceae bacterium]